ncbi:MAG: CHASE2 domain-containing protein [Candidatus Thiodiazotropha sp.]
MNGYRDNKTALALHWFWYFLSVLVLSVLTLLVSQQAPNLLPYESSLNDYFRVTRANAQLQARMQPLDVTLVVVNEELINQLPYRSPVDRCVLAHGLASILSLDPTVVGVDFLLDKRTETTKDSQLKQILFENKSKLVMAVNATDDPVIGLPDARVVEEEFLKEASRASALLIKDEDYVLRNAIIADNAVPTFAAELAAFKSVNTVSGNAVSMFQIDWLAKESGRDDAFPVLPLQLFLDTPVNSNCKVSLELQEPSVVNAVKDSYLRNLIENKIVILGADLSWEDRHVTPLDAVWQENIALSGAAIHANITQQLIDGRKIVEVGFIWALAILVLGFSGGFLLSKFIESDPVRNDQDLQGAKVVEWRRYLVLLVPVFVGALLSGINWLFIYFFGLILPIGLVAIAVGASLLMELFKDLISRSWMVVLDAWVKPPR